MFALGLLSWLYHRPTEGTMAFLRAEVRQEARDRWRPTSPRSRPAGTSARPPRTSRSPTRSSRPTMPPGHATATSPATWPWPTAWSPPPAQSGLPLFLGSYPITPASRHPARAEQAQALRRAHLPGRGRDRRHRRGARRGVRRRRSASPRRPGPGVALKSETIGLAVSLELPLVIVDVQRGGPSTGLPTKTEQADLLQAMFGRNGEAPVPIVAPRSPGGLLRRGDRGGPDRA